MAKVQFTTTKCLKNQVLPSINNPKSSRTADAADSGFQGINDDFPKAHTPHKATKLKPLSKDQKAENKALAKQRIPIEHINGDCKIFKIAQQTYRGKHRNIGDAQS